MLHSSSSELAPTPHLINIVARANALRAPSLKKQCFLISVDMLTVKHLHSNKSKFLKIKFTKTIRLLQSWTHHGHPQFCGDNAGLKTLVSMKKVHDYHTKENEAPP